MPRYADITFTGLLGLCVLQVLGGNGTMAGGDAYDLFDEGRAVILLVSGAVG